MNSKVEKKLHEIKLSCSKEEQIELANNLLSEKSDVTNIIEETKELTDKQLLNRTSRKLRYAIENYKYATENMGTTYIEKTFRPRAINSIHDFTFISRHPDLFEHIEILELDESFKSIPVGIENLKGLKHIALYSSNIQEIPDSIWSLDNLNKFTIKGCKNINTLSKTILNAKNLACLEWDISKVLSPIPEYIFDLPSLKEIALFGCGNIESFPECVWNKERLNKLEALKLWRLNNLISLPESIWNLENINSLSLHHFGKLDLPSVFNLPNLETLDLFGCDSFKKIPTSLLNSEKLTKLTLAGIPNFTMSSHNIDIIRQFKKLTTLVLSHGTKNRLKKQYPDIFEEFKEKYYY